MVLLTRQIKTQTLSTASALQRRNLVLRYGTNKGFSDSRSSRNVKVGDNVLRQKRQQFRKFL